MREKAYEYICKQIREKRQAYGRAEMKPGVSAEELRSLGESIRILEWISVVVLAAKEEA